MTRTSTWNIPRASLLAALVLLLPACGGGNESPGDTSMTQEEGEMGGGAETSPEPTQPANDAPMGTIVRNPMPPDPANTMMTPGEEPPAMMPEPAPDPVATPVDPVATPVDPVATPVDPVATPVDEGDIEAVCARAAECDGAESPTCLDDLAAATELIALFCPGDIAAYLDCLANMTSCEPEVECAEEGLALETCAEDPGAAQLDEETVQMVCSNFAACDESVDPVTCPDDLATAFVAIEVLCPGASTPYLECLAEMSDCDPTVGCPDEVAALEECGLEVNAGTTPAP